MREIHDRMPVILDKATLNDWLSPEIHEPRELKELMKPCPDEWLSDGEISPLVNSPKNNSPEILQPAAVVVGTKGPQRVLFED
jgi:putative SOS response-associated peptidase YedK